MSITYTTKIVVNTPYTITSGDEVLFIDIPGPASVILPSISGGDKKAFYIKDYSGQAKRNPITITAPSGKTIDGNSFAIINNGYAHIQVVYDGTNWKIIS